MRNQQRQGIAARNPELAGDDVPDQHMIITGGQVLEAALAQYLGDIADRAFACRVDAPQHHRQHVRLVHGQGLDFNVGGHPDHPGLGAQLRRDRIPSRLVFGAAGPRRRDHPGVGTERQQLVAKLTLETVHDGEDDDQRGHPQPDTEQ